MKHKKHEAFMGAKAGFAGKKKGTKSYRKVHNGYVKAWRAAGKDKWEIPARLRRDHRKNPRSLKQPWNPRLLK